MVNSLIKADNFSPLKYSDYHYHESLKVEKFCGFRAFLQVCKTILNESLGGFKR